MAQPPLPVQALRVTADDGDCDGPQGVWRTAGVVLKTPLMGMVRRQVYRLLDAFRARGPDALISKRRGQPSSRAHGAVFRQTVLSLVRDRYTDFGPTLVAEKLTEVHGLPIGVETRRQWMIEDGLWVRRRDRLKRIHQPRHLGELVQVDGCEHWWSEDRGPQCTLLVFHQPADAP